MVLTVSEQDRLVVHETSAADRVPAPDETASSRRLLYASVGALLIAGVAAGVVYSLASGGFGSALRRDGEEVRVVRADNRPFKIAPETPGGMEVLNRDKLVYSRFKDAAGKPTVERLLPDAEQPLPLPGPVPKTAPVVPPAPVAAPVSPSLPTSPPPSPPGAVPPAIATATPGLPPQAPATTTPVPQPLAAGSEEESLLPGEAPAEAAPIIAAPVPKPAIRRTPAVTGQPERPAPASPASAPAVGSKPERPSPSSPAPSSPAPSLAAPSPPAPSAPPALAPAVASLTIEDLLGEPPARRSAEGRTAASPSSAKAADPLVAAVKIPGEAAPVTAKPAEKAPAAKKAVFQVQLGAGPSADAARAAWNDALAGNRDLLGSLQPQVMATELAGAGRRLYRLRAGPLASADQAQALCRALRGRDVTCVVVSPGG